MTDKLIVLFVTVCVLHLGIVFSQQSCSDCVAYTQCQAAVDLIRKNDPPSQDKVKRAFCGFQNRTPKVCCASLSLPTSSSSGLDTHRNLRLLPAHCGFSGGERIIGGKEAGLYEFPWMVLISHNTRDGLKFQCGGTLINDRYVLTASHCIKNLEVAGVRVGEHDLRTDEDCQNEPPNVVCERRIQDMPVEEALVHPDYRGKPALLNDIGLLRLAAPVDFTPKNARPVCLPVTAELRNRNIQGVNATITGWGFTEHGSSSPILLWANVPIQTAESCRRKYNRGKPAGEDSTINKFCAGENGRDSCSGDSGGPLMLSGLHNNVKRYIQHGIVSYGPRQCGTEFPGVYTDVSKYMQWILDSIRA